ncbi:hypothetical protein FOZ63_012299, partial [Perkinsus olseni]
ALVPLRGERRSLRSTGFYPVDGEELSVGPGGAPVTQQARPAAAARIDPPRDLVSGFLHGPLGRHSTVLKGFALSKQVDRVFDVYQEMVMNNIPLNTVSFNTIMDACARGGMMDRVSDIFRDMEVQGIEPDIITYSTVVKGYCLAGNVDRAFSVLRDMSGDSQNDRRRRFVRTWGEPSPHGTCESRLPTRSCITPCWTVVRSSTVSSRPWSYSMR